MRLWHDFGTKSKIEMIEVLFHAPEESNKSWRFWIQEKWECGQDGLWKWKEVLEMKEEGADYPEGQLGDLR